VSGITRARKKGACAAVSPDVPVFFLRAIVCASIPLSERLAKKIGQQVEFASGALSEMPRQYARL
jgi:hypothetical protein